MAAASLAAAQSPFPSSRPVPFEDVLGLAYIHASVNGSRPLTMVLDSGAAYTVLQPAVATELKINSSGTVQTHGLGADATLRMAQNATLRFAGQTLTGQTISVLPLDYIEEEAGHKTDGLLGFDVFSKFDILEDYRAHTITLIPPAEFVAPAGYAPIPVIVSGTVALVQLAVGGADGKPVPGIFLIDSGTVGNMILMKPFVDAHPSLQPKKLVSVPSVTAVGGKLDIAVGKLGFVDCGSYSFRNLPAVYMRSQNPGTPAMLAGLLGNGILQKFDVIFDYPHSRIWLKPNADYSKPFPADGSGILPAVKPPRYDAVLVRDVIAGSPAALAGVQAGDRIVRMSLNGGKLLEPGSLSQFRKAMWKPDEHVMLELSRAGKLVTVHFHTRPLI